MKKATAKHKKATGEKKAKTPKKASKATSKRAAKQLSFIEITTLTVVLISLAGFFQGNGLSILVVSKDSNFVFTLNNINKLLRFAFKAQASI